MIFLTAEKWGGLNDILILRLTFPVKWEKPAGKHLIPRSWVNVVQARQQPLKWTGSQFRKWVGEADLTVSQVASTAWKWATPEGPGVTLVRSLINNKLPLFWINGKQSKWKKDTQGATPVLNVLKLVLRNFTFFQTKPVSQVLKEHWPHLRSQSQPWRYYPPYSILNIIESGGDTWFGSLSGSGSLSKDDSRNWHFRPTKKIS